MSVRWCKKCEYSCWVYVFFYSQKLRDPRDFGFNYTGCMWGGVDSTRISHYLHIRFL